MVYKISCPSCGARLSRWHWMTSAIHYRCRSCGVRFRMRASGWALYFAVIAIEVFWYVLFRMHVVSSYVAIGLILVTCGLATWYLPFLTPVWFGRKAEPQSPG